MWKFGHQHVHNSKRRKVSSASVEYVPRAGRLWRKEVTRLSCSPQCSLAVLAMTWQLEAEKEAVSKNPELKSLVSWIPCRRWSWEGQTYNLCHVFERRSTVLVVYQKMGNPSFTSIIVTSVRLQNKMLIIPGSCATSKLNVLWLIVAGSKCLKHSVWLKYQLHSWGSGKGGLRTTQEFLIPKAALFIWLQSGVLIGSDHKIILCNWEAGKYICVLVCEFHQHIF